MAYLFLALTVLSEVSGTIFMKLSAGFSKPVFAGLAVFCYVSTMVAMTMALKSIPLSLVYAVWSGLGLCLVTVFGLVFFQENMSWQKIFFIGLILGGVIGLNLLRTPA